MQRTSWSSFWPMTKIPLRNDSFKITKQIKTKVDTKELKMETQKIVSLIIAKKKIQRKSENTDKRRLRNRTTTRNEIARVYDSEELEIRKTLIMCVIRPEG